VVPSESETTDVLLYVQGRFPEAAGKERVESGLGQIPRKYSTYTKQPSDMGKKKRQEGNGGSGSKGTKERGLTGWLLPSLVQSATSLGDSVLNHSNLPRGDRGGGERKVKSK